LGAGFFGAGATASIVRSKIVYQQAVADQGSATRARERDVHERFRKTALRGPHASHGPLHPVERALFFLASGMSSSSSLLESTAMDWGAAARLGGAEASAAASEH
jgi:hypothetical protein